MTRDARRKALSGLFVVACGLAVLLALVPLGFILFFVVSQGVQALNLDFFTRMPVPVGETGGGMANSIVGTPGLWTTSLGILNRLIMLPPMTFRCPSSSRP